MFVQLLKDHLGQKAGARVDVDEPVAKTLMEQGIAKELAANPLEELVAKSMEGILASLHKTLEANLEHQLKEFAKAQTCSRKGAAERIFGHRDADANPKGNTFGKFLLAVRLGDHKALEGMGAKYVEWNDVPAEYKSTLVTQEGTLGGYAVPDEHYQDILSLVIEKTVVRKRALVIPMSGRTLKVPIVDHATAPASGDTAYLGGMTMTWTEEGAAATEDNPLLEQIDLTNYELLGYVPASNTLQQDFKGLESFLKRLFADGIAWYEDRAFLRGDGVGKPLGAQSWTGFISVTRSAASAFALADYAGVLARWLGEYNARHSCWVAHPTVLAKLYQLVATNSIPLFIDNVRDKPGAMLGGLPLEISEKVPALNTAGDIGVYDFSKYLIGDRQQYEVAFSRDFLFNKNQTAWRVVDRVGGLPWMRDKFTLSDATNTLGPFVGLAAG
jgi:HK97 family phage major capsid protein